MSKPFRLGVSGSSFVHVMPRELVEAAYLTARSDRAPKFDARQNEMMADFMREMMRVMNSGGIDAMECYHSTCWDRELILETILESPRVEFWSVHAPYGRFSDASAPLEEARAGALEAYADTVEVAAKIGAKVVVAHPGVNIPYDVPRDERVRHAADVLQQTADLAGEHCIELAIEPLPKEEIGCNLDELLRVVELVDRPNAGINFDVNHLFPPQEIPSMIGRAGELIRSVHISDQDGTERHWLPFQGTLPWRDVLAALASAGYRGPLVYETHVRDAQTCEDVGHAIIENYQKLIELAPKRLC